MGSHHLQISTLTMEFCAPGTVLRTAWVLLIRLLVREVLLLLSLLGWGLELASIADSSLPAASPSGI